MIRGNDIEVEANTVINGTETDPDALLVGFNNLTLNTQHLLSNRGEILAGQTLRLNADGTLISWGLLQGNSAQITGDSVVINRGAVRALEEIDIAAQSLTNHDSGLIYTANRTASSGLSVTALNNLTNEGRIVSQGDLSLVSENDTVFNQGRVVAVGDISLRAQDGIDNSAEDQRATIYSLGNVNLTTLGTQQQIL